MKIFETLEKKSNEKRLKIKEEKKLKYFFEWSPQEYK